MGSVVLIMFYVCCTVQVEWLVYWKLWMLEDTWIWEKVADYEEENSDYKEKARRYKLWKCIGIGTKDIQTG